MLVYVINCHGKVLMPCSVRKARLLLKQKKARVLKKEPFTIQLLYGSSGYKQEISLGIDAGSKHIGLSATTDKKELYAADVELRNDIVDLISTRRENRRTRRNRLRYRQARFNNRVHSKNKDRLAPSVEQKINCHLKVVEDVHKILPVSKVIVEVASFDFQKIKNPDIEGKEYQQGEQLGFWNVREYVLARDSHVCQCCKGKSKDSILNVHHIESRKTGGNSPDNLITLCETCHTGYHKGTVKLPKNIKRGVSFRDAIFMGIMRWAFYEKLKVMYPDVSMTYGYITKNTRIENNLPKDHYIDARCISGNPLAEPLGYVWYLKKVRCQNRQIHKSNFLKGGIKKLNQAPYLVKGFRLFDKVKFDNQIGFIFGRRTSGYFDIRTLDGYSIHKSASCNKLILISRRGGYLQERRNVAIHPLA
ncbi:MAG: RNA-guided endonuclease IscB [Paludibacteraceae bacterium]|nr:RNA-guided endonuclease IscB [Paludibacteraceae bacterium]